MKATVVALAVAIFSCLMISSAQAQVDGTGRAAPNNHAWWDDRTAGLVGGVGGSVIGIIGGVIGTLAGTGRARGVVFALLNLVGAIGVIGVIAGVVALATGQPYAVWYPLVLAGIVTLPLCLFMRPTIRKRYEAAELARMQSMDVK